MLSCVIHCHYLTAVNKPVSRALSVGAEVVIGTDASHLLQLVLLSCRASSSHACHTHSQATASLFVLNVLHSIHHRLTSRQDQQAIMQEPCQHLIQLLTFDSAPA
jgi:hypothetical protein